MMDIAIRLLGPLEVDVSGEGVDLRGRRQRSVLAMLLIARGAVVSVDRLIDDLWQGEPPPRATGSLQVYVSNLRRALEPDRAPRTPAQVLVSAAPGYALRLPDAVVDAWHFEQLVRIAAEAPAASAAVTLEQALGLWRGDALAEFAGESWGAPEAARLDELRLVARERLVDAWIRTGRPDEAVLGAEALVRELPLREEGWRLLALGQYLAGRQGEALASLRRARAVLTEELGIDPGPRLARLEQDVLAQTVVLDPEPAAGLAPPPRAAAGDSPHPPRPGAAFVGRVCELDALRAAAAAARPGAPGVGLVAGEAGGGKSALLARLRDDLRERGWRVVVGRCPEADGGPPARAWAEVARSLAIESDPGALAGPLAQLLSDEALADQRDGALAGRFRLHRAMHEWLDTLGDRPLAVLLDDVHRADTETRALLTSLLDQGPAIPLVVVLAYRPEPGAALDELLAALAPYTPTRVRLVGLAEPEAAALMQTVTGAPPNAELVRALTERTDGNPFYLLESTRLLASEGELVATSQVPEGVADVLRRRLARLPEEAVSVLRLASVVGRDVDVALLVRAAELAEDAVLDALETGLISGLLVEPAPGAVRFSHLLVRETLYAGIPQLRRVRWHARVADAAAGLYPADASAIAHHAARAATPATGAEASRRCLAAADLAASRFAFDTQAELCYQAQRCLQLVPAPDPADLVDVLVRRVHALIASGGTTTAIHVRREAIAVAETTGDPLLLARAVCSGTVPMLRASLRGYGEIDHELVATIERVLRSDALDRAQRCLTLCTLVRETSEIDDPRCEPAYLEALELGRAEGDPHLLGLVLWSGQEVYARELRSAQSEATRLEFAALAEAHDLPMYRIVAHVMGVNQAGLLLDLAAAGGHLASARALCRQYQLPQGLFLCAVLEAMLALLGGDLERAEAIYAEEFEHYRRRGTVDAAGAELLARTMVRYNQGRLGELVDDLHWMYVNALPAVGHLLVLALAERGDVRAARDLLDELPPRHADYLWLTFSTMRGLAITGIGATELAAESYAELLPFAGLVAGAATNAFALTPVARALGRLALLLDRPDDARRHFEQAREVARRCGSQLWLDQAEADLRTVPLSVAE